MTKTVKEIAEEIGVTKQAISRLLTKNFREKHVTIKSNNGGSALQIDNIGERLLKEHFKGSNVVPLGTNERYQQLVDTLKQQVETQQDELYVKNEQLVESNNRLKGMQKLLDQSQQLQLIAEKKIAALEAPKQTEDDADQNKESPVTSAPKGPILPSTDNQKRGFWHKFFK